MFDKKSDIYVSYIGYFLITGKIIREYLSHEISFYKENDLNIISISEFERFYTGFDFIIEYFNKYFLNPFSHNGNINEKTSN